MAARLRHERGGTGRVAGRRTGRALERDDLIKERHLQVWSRSDVPVVPRHLSAGGPDERCGQGAQSTAFRPDQVRAVDRGGHNTLEKLACDNELSHSGLIDVYWYKTVWPAQTRSKYFEIIRLIGGCTTLGSAARCRGDIGLRGRRQCL